MKKNLIVSSIISIIIIFLIIIGIYFLTTNNKSKNIKLDSNYKALIGLRMNSDIILVINQKDKVSNILYLNKTSASTLANQKIEGKDLALAVELIVDKLKNKNEFDNGEELYITRYSQDKIYATFIEELNKEFVIYGIDNKLVEQTDDLSTKLNQLKLKTTDSTITNIETLYQYSKKILTKD